MSFMRFKAEGAGGGSTDIRDSENANGRCSNELLMIKDGGDVKKAGRQWAGKHLQ
jgi:hypothetical protein